ncbi:MAG TPA: stage II sporulation protein M, partial [Pyrinomonadaceae bacterium]|nr:stage II sporulation protein M [Pyrinomonadaceae bacterium]
GSNTQWWTELNAANQIGSSAILTNNIRVAFYAFALGAFFGIGTLYVLLINGLSIGGVLGVCYRVDPNFGNLLVDFMVAHGVVELSCIFIAAGAGMSIGYAIIDPGDLTRGQALKFRGREAAKLVVGVALFLFAAGIIEGFISPSYLAPAVKWLIGITTGILMFVYLFLVGRDREPMLQTH